MKPVCLTIAGLDPSGGAGVIADVKVFTAFGCFATAAIASLTFQNTTGVFGAVHQSAATLRAQVEPILSDFRVAAVKTGMLPTREIIEESARVIWKAETPNVVIDPVVRSTSGFDLIDDEALRALVEVLFPLAAIVTPNLPEAERIVGFPITDADEINGAGAKILSMGPGAVLIKGGHLAGDRLSEQAIDRLYMADGKTEFAAPFIETSSTHGTGCSLAAAIAANLALGKQLKESVATAKEFVHRAIADTFLLGRGNSPIDLPTSW